MPDRRRGGRRLSLSRPSNFREIAQRFLIVCEGKNTEPNYFKAFKVPHDIKTIEVIGIGQNTASLVLQAIKLMKKLEYDQVWCVFDVEDNSEANIHKAIRLARKYNIKIACSNQKFELWYLLHFNYYHTAIDRSQYDSLLGSLMEVQYVKNLEMYSRLVSRQWQAIQYAEQLLDIYHPYDPAISNPSTTVHLLVQELNRFTPESRT